jgi:hypothetical protein
MSTPSLRRGSGQTLAVAAVLVLVLPVAQPPQAQDSPVFTAMQDEMARSMRDLRLADQPSPYYIEYEVRDRAATRVTARLGALVEDLNAHNRTLRVAVRVGDYAFDSSLFNAPPVGSGVLQLSADGSTTLPLDDSYGPMRRQMWLATDTAYKRAVGVFARKRAAFQNRAAGEELPDFSREQPVETLLPGLPPIVVNRAWPERTKAISAVFAGPVMKAIDNSEVSVADTRGTRYYLNSEGFKVVAPIQIASIHVSADARADDGMTVREAFTLVEKHLQDLPAMPDILRRTREMVARLSAARVAPIGEEYTGPVLLEGQASAEIVAQTLVQAVLARRPPEAAGGRGGGRGGGGGGQVTPFLSRIGLRVLTDAFSLSDMASLTEFDGRPVAGSYQVDDFGIRPKDVTLVEKGRLMTLIAGRAPLRGLLQSNGHSRSGDVQAGVISMQSSEAVPAAELKQKYIDLLKAQGKDFGYIVRGVATPAEAPGGGPGTGPMIFSSVRVSLDGREVPVRGMRFGAIAPPVFRDLLDASRERTLYSFRATLNDAVSVVVPNLIFEELEIQRAREIVQKPPSVPSPLTD